MCGIVAVIGGRHTRRGTQILERLRHRGPDGSGALELDECYLGMARLAILDPSARADQPMSWKGHHIVYNGELYNFRALRAKLQGLGVPFETSGDTEVVLKALVHWGVEAFRQFSGMFALAIWNEHERKLTVARDRFGIKPLYWRALDEGGIAIASEATPLAALTPTRPRLDAVREFLRFGSPISSCIYEDLMEVDPGTVTAWSADGSSHTLAFGPLPDPKTDAPATLRAIGSEFLLSDRPVALFLSGGFDSAAVAAATVTTSVRPVAVTLATSGNQDDVERAIATASHYGLESRIVNVTSSDIGATLNDFFNAMDQPTVDGFNTFLVSRAAIESGFPVALSGLGGDEVMGGYGYYRWRRHIDLASAMWRRTPNRLRAITARGAARTMHRRPSEFRAILDAGSLFERHRAWRTLFTAEETARLTGADAPPSAQWSSDPWAVPEEQLSQLDFQTYLRPTLLRDTDAFSMANSVEVRVPLLDERFVTAMQASPRRLGKDELARGWGDDYLSALARKPKLTFGLPWRSWIGSVITDKADILNDVDPWGGLVDPSEAKRALTASESSGKSGALRSWALIILAVWLSRSADSRWIEGRKV